MKEDEILEGNKLIAEFLGYQILHKKFQYENWNSSNESYWEWSEGEIVCDKHGREVSEGDSDPYCSFEHLPFNSSWDWLMQVIEKINEISRQGESIKGLNVELYKLLSMEICTELKDVYNGVKNFIEWYNNNKY